MSTFVVDPEFDFADASLATKNIRVKGKRYIITEAGTSQGVTYKNALQKRAKRNEEGEFAGWNDIADTDRLLVSLCTFETDPEGNILVLPNGIWVNVPETEVNTWPNKVTKKIYSWIVEVSELHDPDSPETIEKEIRRLEKKLAKIRKEPAKNGQPS